MGRSGRDLEVEPGSKPVPGRTASVGKYQLLAILGRGGMADVFLALSRGPMGFNKLVVVKRLRAALADDTQFRNMFLDEARLAARLNHPNVVHTYEVGAHEGVYFIAMEYLEGQSLNKVIKEALKREEEFDLNFCARVVSDALAGLHHAHELRDYDGTPLRIIHRDVSPHNVFVTYDGVVKLVDFGIAKAALSSVETEVGVLKGKVAYMSPEQADGRPLDQRADVFAMGIVLWELLTRQRLMQGDSAAATLHRLMNVPIPALSSVRPDADPELEAIVARSLEKDPADRFQSAQEMRDALEAYIAQSGHPIRPDDVGRRVSAMFQTVREEIQHQIHLHMEGVTQVPMPSEELSTLTADSIKQIPKAPPRDVFSSGQLPMLHANTGSGSGVVANLPGPGFATFPPPAPAAQTGVVLPNRKRGLVLWLVAAAAVGVLAIAALSLRHEPILASAPAPPAQPTTPFVEPTAPQGQPPPPAALTVLTPAPPSPGDTAGEIPAQPLQPHTTVRPQPQAAARHPQGPATHAPPPPPPPAATAAPPATDDSTGFLTLDTYPWTRVSENGKVLGTTPIVHLALPAGPHTLVLENADQGIKQSYSVTIKGGDTVSRRLGLK
jgi:serine/threonine protein kinase